MNKAKIKCYIYTRVSTALQVDGYSLDAQRETMRKYADFQNMEIVREYSDEGHSGKNIQGRQEFVRMLNDIEDGKDEVSFVLVFKLSRFGRNVVYMSFCFILTRSIRNVASRKRKSSCNPSRNVSNSIRSAGKIPVIRDDEELARIDRISMENSTQNGVDLPLEKFPTHETVVSLSLKNDSPKIEVSMKPGEDSLYEPKDKGTYEKIKAYVLEKYGLKVSSLYIAQVKYKCGLDRFPLDRDIYLVGFFLEKMGRICNRMIANDYTMIYNIIKKGGDRYVKRISTISNRGYSESHGYQYL